MNAAIFRFVFYFST
ncbi:pheST operon leader peptide PheM [Klebsiella pneumoniae]|nr:pheST operon leader peptide PheM [Klebsiella pneumoniae]